jgi:hypothetical protein
MRDNASTTSISLPPSAEARAESITGMYVNWPRTIASPLIKLGRSTKQFGKNFVPGRLS